MSLAATPAENDSPARSASAGWRGRLAAGWRRACDIDLLAALPLLTIVLLLEATPDAWYLRTPLLAACAIGLAYTRILPTVGFWFVVATLIGATVYLQWDSADNHKYLFVYWCLALASTYSLARAHQHEALATASRLLIGLCMLLATVWKVASANYVDGSFFEFTLLTDSRFSHFAAGLTDLSLDALQRNQRLEGLLTTGYLRGIDVDTVTLVSSAAVGRLALFLTWWTVLIEGLLALLFLLPDSGRTARARNIALLLFAATTYSVATVRGFGWVLMLLGMAQCPGERDRHFRLAYLGGFLLIQAFTMPARFLLGL